MGEEFAQLLRNKASKAKVKVLYNAVGTYSYNPYNKDARNILFLGVLCERKGVYNLLQAIKLLDPQIDKTINVIFMRRWRNGESKANDKRIGY